MSNIFHSNLLKKPKRVIFITWNELFLRKKKPTFDELLAYFPDKIRILFLSLNETVSKEFSVYNNFPQYQNSLGWTYNFCRNYRFKLFTVFVTNNSFFVDKLEVTDENSLENALNYIKKLYLQGYEERYSTFVAAKKENQKARTATRIEREKHENEQVLRSLDASKLNNFSWSKKASRTKILLLYKQNAKGIFDENLIDDVGFAFFSRCKQTKEVRELLEKGKLLCHNCGNILTPNDYISPVFCSCGNIYTYREYRRSCNANNMPGGRASEIFNNFVNLWQQSITPTEKMLQIDCLIHECHVSLMSGIKGRSVCVNLIEGSKKQITDLILTLSSG